MSGEKRERKDSGETMCGVRVCACTARINKRFFQLTIMIPRELSTHPLDVHTVVTVGHVDAATIGVATVQYANKDTRLTQRSGIV